MKGEGDLLQEVVVQPQKKFELTKHISEKINAKVYYVYCLCARVIEDAEDTIQLVVEQRYSITHVNELLINLLSIQLELNKNIDFFEIIQTEIKMLGVNVEQLVEIKLENNYLGLVDFLRINVLPILYQIQDYILREVGTLPENQYIDSECYSRNLARIVEERCNFYEEIRPFLEQVEDEHKVYQLQFSSTGHKTLCVKINNQTIHLHSIRNVIKEANDFADYNFQDEIENYNIYGLGLGYHQAMLIKRLPAYVKVNIFESDLNIIRYAFDSCNLSAILENPSVRVFYDPDLLNLEKQVDLKEDNSKLIIHMPSFHCISSHEMKLKLLEIKKRCRK